MADGPLEEVALPPVSLTELGGFGALFTAQAEEYAKYRPGYGRPLFDTIYTFARLPHKRLAVDMGCGNGQVCTSLALNFEQVMGIDSCAAQLQHAVSLPNVRYIQAPAEATGIADRSADLVTAATCLHWFEVPLFYREVRRILKPSGALAAWAFMPYAISFPGREEAGEVLMRLQRKVFPYFHPRLQHFLHNHYEGQEPAAADFREVELKGLQLEREVSVEFLVGWVRTWTCWPPFVAEHGEAAREAALQHLQAQLLQELGVKDVQELVPSVWPATLILARQPVPL